MERGYGNIHQWSEDMIVVTYNPKPKKSELMVLFHLNALNSYILERIVKHKSTVLKEGFIKYPGDGMPVAEAMYRYIRFFIPSKDAIEISKRVIKNTKKFVGTSEVRVFVDGRDIQNI